MKTNKTTPKKPVNQVLLTVKLEDRKRIYVITDVKHKVITKKNRHGSITDRRIPAQRVLAYRVTRLSNAA